MVYNTVGFKEPEAKVFLSSPITAKILEVERFTSAQDRFNVTTQRSVNKVRVDTHTWPILSTELVNFENKRSFCLQNSPNSQKLQRKAANPVFLRSRKYCLFYFEMMTYDVSSLVSLLLFNSMIFISVYINAIRWSRSRRRSFVSTQRHSSVHMTSKVKYLICIM